MRLYKKGSGIGLFFAILMVVAIILILGAVLVSYVDVNIPGLEDLPGGIEASYNLILAVFGPIMKGVYAIIGPVDATDNVKMIALAIFFLMAIVGNYSLKPLFRDPLWGLIVGIVIGVIASRLITDVLIDESAAIFASPLAAVIAVVGFLPLLFVTKRMSKWDLQEKHFTVVAVYSILAIGYIALFKLVFDTWTLGIIFAAGCMIIALGGLVFPLAREHVQEEKDKQTGEVAGVIHKDMKALETMAKGAERSGR